jgi:virginiamycin B lyase
LNNNSLTNEISVPDGDSATYIAYGSDGNIWVSASGGSAPLMLVINPATDTILHQISLPAGTHPNGVVAGKDNAMWFADSGNNAVGEITIPSYAVTEYPLISTGAQPREITVGPDGSLWLTEFAAGKLAHVIP